MSLDLVLIRRFEAVARLGSFSAAADEVGVTHSAMTKSIRTLEELWGVRLFERTTRSVVPTAAGRRDLKIQPVIEEPYHLLCGPTHPAATNRDADALLQHDWAIAGFDPGFAANLAPDRREALQRSGFPRFRLSSQKACVDLARHGLIVTMAPRSGALKACTEGGLISYEVPGIAPFALAAMTLADVPDQAAADFIEIVSGNK